MKFYYSLKLMSAKFFSESRPLSGDCRAVSLNLFLRHLNLTKLLLVLLVFGLAAGCSQKRRVTKNPDKQFYQEAPKHYLPFPAIPLKGAMFLKADRDLRSDLVWFSSVPEKGARIWILLNRGRQGFDYSNSRIRAQEFERGILFLTVGDLNKDRADDLLLITPPTDAGSAKILFNKTLRPRLVGKSDEKGNTLLPSDGELSPSLIALTIGNRLLRLKQDTKLEEKLTSVQNFLDGLNVYKGQVTYKAVADVFGHKFVSPTEALN